MSTSTWVGSATLSAIVALENARPAPDSESSNKTVYFDAHFFLSDSLKRKSTQALGLLRYFNQFDYDFNPEGVHFCFVVANVAKMNAKAAIHASTDVDAGDYSIVGDIIQLIPAGDGVNPRHPVMIHTSGLVSSIDETNGAFKLCPTQYVYPLRELSNPKPSFPMECIFNTSSIRWKNKRPMPAKSSYVAVSGFLCGTKTSGSQVDEFQVEVEKVSFLGKSFTPIAAASPAPTTPAKRGLKFSFDTPTPAPKKPRLMLKTASQAIASSPQSASEVDNEQGLDYVDGPSSPSQPDGSSQGGSGA